jgi:RNA polymerase sigma-70 factor (ECF subfamily)
MHKTLIAQVKDPSSLPEAELLAMAKARQPGALREIMQRNSPRLYRLARSILRNDSDAEDVLQETYLRAFQHLEDFRGDAAISTWLTRIALNEALGRLRRRRATVELSAVANVSTRDDTHVVPFPTTSIEIDPEMTLARKQMVGLLETAIDNLPDPFRVVFVLRSIHEMSVQETARQLGVPEGTVKTRLHRARLLLRQSLEVEFGSALESAFPFAGRRCARISEAVLSQLGINAERRN